MSTAERAVGDDETDALFSGLEGLPGFVLAVSGGPDSTALLLLAARWAKRRKRAPKLLAVTVDHGLRNEAAAEANAVKRQAQSLNVAHRMLRWRGEKPKTGLQEAARIARYGLLAQAAQRAGFGHILTAHTLDDQAETVLFRMARGSGIAGLAGMARASRLPAGKGGILLLRPLLGLAKARLYATLDAAKVVYHEDPTNSDPRFARPRLRMLLPALADEGLDARGLARLAMRMRRAELTIECAVAAAREALAPGSWRERGPVVFETARFASLPAEVALRLLGRAVVHTGNEGPVELGKLESLYDSLAQAPAGLRRTLAGSQITLARGRISVERAPSRHNSTAHRNRNTGFTK